MLWLDFETRSRCDLLVSGAYNYAQDISTEVLCMSYAFDDEDVQTWRPGQPFPERVRQYDGEIRAHNAAFERLIFWYVLQINFRLEQFYCTATQARANCAPGSLEDVGRFAGAGMQKDHRGAQLIRLLSIPMADGSFREDAALLDEMVAYCEQDVRAMRAVSQALRPLSAQELADYHVNERVNDRGVLVDVPLAQAARAYAVDELASIQAEVAEITGGAITSVRSPKMRDWVWDHVGPAARQLMTVVKDDVKKISIDKSVRAGLLALAEEAPDEIPPAVAEVVQAADDLWASSVAKFTRLEQLADVEDQRVRGAFVFAGGAATGRASSYGAQVHNFARKTSTDPESVRHAMVRGHALVPKHGARVTDVLKSMLRPALIPRAGASFVVADWSAIEGRVNPWLANSPSGEVKLDVFRRGLDPYKVNAMETYRVGYDDVTDEQRQSGKVQELACGFLGGAGSFATFGKVYGLRMTPSEMQAAVGAWRRANPWAMQHGQDLELAYVRAMRNRGHAFDAGRTSYLYDGQHLWYALPSGRILCYPFARLEEDGVSYAKASWKPAADAKEWPRGRLWRGLAVENCWSGDTKLVTMSGVKPISRVLVTDLIWDGVEWVRHGGVVCNGEQEVVEWLGLKVTPSHLIRDGQGWKAVTHLDARSTDSCLNWARGLEPSRCLEVQDVSPALNATAAGDETSISERCGGLTFLARAVQSLRDTLTSWKTPRCAAGGSIGLPAPFLGATTPITKRSKTTAREGSKSLPRGVRTPPRGLNTLRHWKTGTLRAWTWIASTMTETMRRAICVLSPGLPTPITAGVQRTYPSRGKASPSQTFGGNTAPAGAVTTRSRTTYPQADLAMKSPKSTGERTQVFDVLNCGPRHQYMVITPVGPVIAHNCTQAVANDLLRHALRQLEPLGVVLHVHDEIVIETDRPDEVLDEMRRVMTTPPEWAAGLPLAIGAKIMTRYGK